MSMGIAPASRKEKIESMVKIRKITKTTEETVSFLRFRENLDLLLDDLRRRRLAMY